MITLFQFCPSLVRRNPPFRGPVAVLARIHQTAKAEVMEVKERDHARDHRFDSATMVARLLISNNAQTNVVAAHQQGGGRLRLNPLLAKACVVSRYCIVVTKVLQPRALIRRQIPF